MRYPISNRKSKAVNRQLYLTLDAPDHALIVSLKRRVYLSNGYPAVRINGRCVRLHRILLESELAAVPEGCTLVCDHVNGDRFDLRRVNLRLITIQENARNRRVCKKSTSVYLGVSKTASGRFMARYYVTRGKPARSLGSYGTEEQAARARDAFAIMREGPNISVNFDDGRMSLVSPKWLREAGCDLFEFTGSGGPCIAVQFVW